ncbi:molybdate ABC transporter substrate-binding protein [Listeria costaricensis]|uniref:molybdate ABC transporter substrate-binding protein n=1 Tax=Listeria costaricensis TaxID=2026604 RepID=UPI000C08B9BE|nr:molybdate ABC transporter substrate-binding protein [Listeria costaricensis]
MKKILLMASLLAILLTGCTTNGEKESIGSPESDPIEIHLSAAASLKESVEEIRRNFEKENPSIKLTIDYASSGQIRERVKNGAPIDGVLFASEQDLDALIDEKLAKGKEKFATNRLVLIQPKEAKGTDEDWQTALKQAERIAMGDPESVPAGSYAKETLESLKLYDSLHDQLVFGSDVRQVLSYVASGNAELGFVYQTDAAISPDVKIVQKIPEDLHTEIGYYAGIITDSSHTKAVQTFMDQLTAAESQQILQDHGFQTVN